MKVDTSSHGDDNENVDESEIAEKPSRAQRKRLRKKMLKEEAARRRKVIGPLLPTEMIQTRVARVEDAGGSNGEGDSHGEEEASCSQPARLNAQEKEGTTAFDFQVSTISLVSTSKLQPLNYFGKNLKFRTYLTRFQHLYEIQIKGYEKF